MENDRRHPLQQLKEVHPDRCTVSSSSALDKERKRAKRQTDPNNLPTLKTHATRKYVYKCTFEGCDHEASRAGRCWSHGAKDYYRKEKRNYPNCSVEGCTNRAVLHHLCTRHGAKVPKKICNVDGCNNKVVRQGVCQRHGAKKVRHSYSSYTKCQHEGCKNHAHKWELCSKHGLICK